MTSDTIPTEPNSAYSTTLFQTTTNEAYGDTTVISDTIPMKPNSAYSTTLCQTIRTTTNEAYGVITPSTT